MKIVTVDEMRTLETRAAQEYGLTSQILMENAGRSAAEILVRYIAEKDNARPLDELAFLVLVGPGNNGGARAGSWPHPAAWGGRLTATHWEGQHFTAPGREISAAGGSGATGEAPSPGPHMTGAPLGNRH